MSQHTELSPQIDRDLVEYHRVSGWAIAGLVFGVLSAAAVVGPLLWFVPALAIVVSLIAIWRIQSSDGQLSGRNVALLGLLLAIFFGAAGPARTMTRRYWLESRAEPVAKTFFELLQQKQSLAAYLLTKPAEVRKPLPADDPDPFAKDPEAKKSYDEFLQLEPVAIFLSARQPVTVELSPSKLLDSNDRSDIVGVPFRITSPDHDGPPITGQLFVERSLAHGSQTEQFRVFQPSASKE